MKTFKSTYNHSILVIILGIFLALSTIFTIASFKITAYSVLSNNNNSPTYRLDGFIKATANAGLCDSDLRQCQCNNKRIEKNTIGIHHLVVTDNENNYNTPEGIDGGSPAFIIIILPRNN